MSKENPFVARYRSSPIEDLQRLKADIADLEEDAVEALNIVLAERENEAIKIQSIKKIENLRYDFKALTLWTVSLFLFGLTLYTSVPGIESGPGVLVLKIFVALTLALVGSLTVAVILYFRRRPVVNNYSTYDYRYYILFGNFIPIAALTFGMLTKGQVTGALIDVLVIVLVSALFIYKPTLGKPAIILYALLSIGVVAFNNAGTAIGMYWWAITHIFLKEWIYKK